MIGTFLTLAAAAMMAASDSTSYVVLNHGRGAGDMVIVKAGAQQVMVVLPAAATRLAVTEGPTYSSAPM